MVRNIDDHVADGGDRVGHHTWSVKYKLEVFQEYYIADVDSIKEFINLIAVNADFDYLSFINA